jgi:hypothetical protein
MTEIISETFAQLLARYRQALSWYSSLGAEIRNSRLGHYGESLQELAEGFADPSAHGILGRDKQFTNALYEANQHCAIHEGLAGHYDDYVKRRIKFVANGPRLYTDELTSASSEKGRNIVFELALASWFARAGFQISPVRTGDLTLQFDDVVLAFECKRPQSVRGLLRAVKDAGKQVKSRLRVGYQSFTRSIVAVDITKIVNPDFGLLTATTFDEGLDQLKTGMQAMADFHAEDFIRLLPRRNLGVLMRATAIAHTADRKSLTYCSQHLMTFLRVSGTPNAPIADAFSKRMRESGVAD